jgi:hypothetical protein
VLHLDESGDSVVLAWGGKTVGGSHDTSASVARVAADGKVRWSVTCESVGAPASYADQEVYAEVRGEHLVVVSQATVASYVEVRSLATGARERRWVLPPRK